MQLNAMAMPTTSLIRWRQAGLVLAAASALVAVARDAEAQLDPLLFLKTNKPHVLLAVDTSSRMQRDVNNDYLDANVYKVVGGLWEKGLSIAPPAKRYRRKYVGLVPLSGGALADKFTADHIEAVSEGDSAYGTFDEATRLAIARNSLVAAVQSNASAVRFGLLRTRQASPRFLTPASLDAERWQVNEQPVAITNDAWPDQKQFGDAGLKWRITWPVVNQANGSIGGPVAPLVASTAPNANAEVLRILQLQTGAADSLIAAGLDGTGVVDAPIDTMLDDLLAAAGSIAAVDTQCCNTVAVLVAGGGRGTTSNGDPVAKAGQFLAVGAGKRRVPIYVIGIAPLTDADRAQLSAIASATGGRFTEITKAMVDRTPPGQPVPELVRAVNYAVSHAFAAYGDVNSGKTTEHQVTSPVVGTVNLIDGVDINGNELSGNDVIRTPKGTEIPQRGNVMVTSGFTLPGFDGRLRAFRMYRPVADSSKPSGYKFVSDGTRLWVAAAPDAAERNIFTAIPDGAGGVTMVPFVPDAATAALLQPYLRVSDVSAAQRLIEFIRAQPLGAIVGSTPAIMDPPSLDPPPDSIYPQFADAHKNRRSIVWVGANDGMLHAIDGRLGKEVWAFIPFNLLPKLRALLSGQPPGDFRYFVDSSPKIADVRIDGAWRTYLILGQGAGGTFYQTFDVTLDGIGSAAPPVTATLSDVLGYFRNPSAVPLKWTFPRYADFDVTVGQWGDIASTADALAKSVGQTWSDPAVGQIENGEGPFTVLTGSGFFKWSVQQQAHRGKIVAGTTFYLLDAKTGLVLDSRDVGSDGLAETVDDCAAVDDCTKLKNALQADPVATGPADSRFVTRAYIGDLDGEIWRFDLGLDAAKKPRITSLKKVLNGSASQPNFSSMATVNVGGAQQYLFQGTGSDLLPSNGVSTSYQLNVVLDTGGATKNAPDYAIALEKVDGTGGDEKVTAFPAVAGDIVFFATTTLRDLDKCVTPEAKLYAFTFLAGPAYDTNGDGKLSSSGGSGDSVVVKKTSGARASAPFIADQHLVFSTGGKVELFGDREDFNNGVGQAGVRILSWREVR